MDNIIKIEMDIVYDFYDTPQYNNELAQFGVTDHLIELYGPGGGNPNVYLCGTRDQLESLLTFWEWPTDDIAYFIDGE